MADHQQAGVCTGLSQVGKHVALPCFAVVVGMVVVCGGCKNVTTVFPVGHTRLLKGMY